MSGTESGKGETIRCDHCQLEMHPDSAVTAEFDGETKYFCCHGCLGVYELIHRESLDTFYSSRCGWTPGPPAMSGAQPGAFRDAIRKSGDLSSLDMSLSGIRCASCVWLVEKFLTRMEGVESARVNYATHRLSIRWNDGKIPLPRILDAIRSIGYTPHPYLPTSFGETLRKEKNDLLLRFGTAAFFSMQLMLFVTALYAGFFQGIEDQYRLTFQLVSWALATPVLFYSGYPFLRNALRALPKGALNMDVLVALGSFSAYAYSVAMIFTGGEVYFDTSAMIVTFILLGRFLEAGSRVRAGDTIASLVEMQPREARLLGGDQEAAFVPLEKVRSGDTVEVRAGETIPLDGTVVEGEADVNESMLTGESRPAFKNAGREVFAGTISVNGRLAVRVTGKEDETLLARIIRTVEDAQARKAPIQTLADKTAGWFVPAVILFAACTLAFRLSAGAGSAAALMQAVSVLVVACPCALGLATPLAILLGTSSAAKAGILVKGGDVFETLSKTDRVVLDKTGTITSGMPSVTDIVACNGQDELLRFAASLEKFSEHPAGKAIVQAYGGAMLPVDGFRVFPGRGVAAVVDGRPGLAGNLLFMRENGVSTDAETEERYARLAATGKTVVFVAVRKELAGLIALIDDVRDDATGLAGKLRKQGIRTSMLTGDVREVADYVAAKCAIEDVRAGLNPVEKAEAVRRMRSQGDIVMMVGDGINDAPALTEADTGVSLGHASDIALESAGAVIMRDDLALVADLVRGSRRCFSVIRQNLFWAFSYNVVALPLAVAGFLHPIVSALLMACSSLVVVGNALRLRKF